MKVSHHKGSYNDKIKLQRIRSSIKLEKKKKEFSFLKKIFSRNKTPNKKNKKSSKKKKLELQNLSIAELKEQHKWKDVQRTFDWGLFGNLQVNELEGFLIEKMDMHGAFNQNMAANIGDDFFKTIYCLPLLLCRYDKLDLRNRLRFVNSLPDSVPPPMKVGFRHLDNHTSL